MCFGSGTRRENVLADEGVYIVEARGLFAFALM